MNLSNKFALGTFVGCIGFLFSFIFCAILSAPSSIMLVFCVSFLSIIIISFTGFYISYTNSFIEIKSTFNFYTATYKKFIYNILYNKNKQLSTKTL